MHIAAKIGIGVGLVAGAGLLLAACGEKDPSEVPNDLFKDFDKDGNGISKDEAVKRFQRTYTDRTYGLRVGDYVQYTDTIKQTTWAESMLRAHGAADKNNDAIASWAELTALAQTFDKDADGVLQRGERNSFKDQFGVQTLDRHTTILGQDTGLEYRPRRDDYPDNGGGYGGGTSPGDDGGYGGGTSPGDDYGGGYNPPSGGSGSGGTSGGDDGGSYNPPSGGSGGSSGSGNSTDNGNPSEDDF